MLIISCCSLSEAKTLSSLQNTLSVTKCDIAKRILRTSAWEKADVFRRIKSPRSLDLQRNSRQGKEKKGEKTTQSAQVEMLENSVSQATWVPRRQSRERSHRSVCSSGSPSHPCGVAPHEGMAVAFPPSPDIVSWDNLLIMSRCQHPLLLGGNKLPALAPPAPASQPLADEMRSCHAVTAARRSVLLSRA